MLLYTKQEHIESISTGLMPSDGNQVDLSRGQQVKEMGVNGGTWGGKLGVRQALRANMRVLKVTRSDVMRPVRLVDWICLLARVYTRAEILATRGMGVLEEFIEACDRRSNK